MKKKKKKRKVNLKMKGIFPYGKNTLKEEGFLLAITINIFLKTKKSGMLPISWYWT